MNLTLNYLRTRKFAPAVPYTLFMCICAVVVFMSTSKNKDNSVSPVAVNSEMAPTEHIPCASNHRTEALQPHHNYSQFELAYAEYPEGSSIDTWRRYQEYTFPYRNDCMVSLFKKEGGDKIVVTPNILSLMDGLRGASSGSPKPFVFLEDKLIFGGNGHEGLFYALYVFEPSSLIFRKLTDSLGEIGHSLSPDGKKLLVVTASNKIKIYDLALEKAYEVVLDLDSKKEETLIEYCAMGCGSDVEWRTDNTISYAVWQGDPSMTTHLVEIKTLTFDPAKYPEVPMITKSLR